MKRYIIAECMKTYILLKICCVHTSMVC